MDILYRHSSYQPELRTATKSVLRDLQASHRITLAFHDRFPLHRANQRLCVWYCRLMRRLFGRSWADLERTQLAELVVLPEGVTGHVHFHGVIRVPEKHEQYFHRVAASLWKTQVPKGEIHLDYLRCDLAERYFDYATKSEAGWSEFIHLPLMRT